MKKLVVAILVCMFAAGTVWAMGAPEGAQEQLTLKQGDKIKDFELPDASGKIIKSAELRKGKVFVVRIIAISDNMAVARMQTTILKEMKQKHGDKVAFVDVVSKDNGKPEEVAARMKELGSEWPVVNDTKGEVAASIGATTLPVMLVYDKEGLSIRAQRYIKPEDFEQFMGEKK